MDQNLTSNSGQNGYRMYEGKSKSKGN